MGFEQSVSPSERADPTSFHSRYDPRKEAARFVERCLEGKHPSLVIIIGGGLNYAGAETRRRLPKARLVSLQPSPIFDGLEACDAEYRWSPTSTLTIESTLSTALAPEYSGGGIAVIEWPPVAKAFTAECDAIRQAVRQALSLSSSDIATVAYWSRRWLINSLRFIAGVRRTASVVRGEGPVLIACAGPSLTECLDDILKRGAASSLWSLASASAALESRGVKPDLVVSTDPGFWNSHHLRSARDMEVPIAMPPSSYVPAELLERSIIMPIDTGLGFERMAIEALGSPASKAKASGSSAGTAISLALASTSGVIHVLGFDLAARGLDDHVRPYAFDILDDAGSSRTRPTLSARSSRLFDAFEPADGTWRKSRAFSAYASASSLDSAQGSRVFRYGSSPVYAGLRDAVGLDAAAPSSGAPPSLIESSRLDLGRRERKAIARGLLDEAARRASALAESAIAEGRPLPREATISYLALAGKAAAETLARAARGITSVAELAALDVVAAEGAAELASL